MSPKIIIIIDRIKAGIGNDAFSTHNGEADAWKTESLKSVHQVLEMIDKTKNHTKIHRIKVHWLGITKVG